MDNLYREEVDCFVANQDAPELFLFGVNCIIIALITPFQKLWINLKIRVRG